MADGSCINWHLGPREIGATSLAIVGSEDHGGGGGGGGLHSCLGGGGYRSWDNFPWSVSPLDNTLIGLINSPSSCRSLDGFLFLMRSVEEKLAPK